MIMVSVQVFQGGVKLELDSRQPSIQPVKER
jgi:hypothetical protein